MDLIQFTSSYKIDIKFPVITKLRFLKILLDDL